MCIRDRSKEERKTKISPNFKDSHFINSSGDMCIVQKFKMGQVEMKVIKKRYFSDFFDSPKPSTNFGVFVIRNWNNVPKRLKLLPITEFKSKHVCLPFRSDLVCFRVLHK